MTGSFGALPLPERADVVVIGGGVVGCAIARELSRFELSVVLIESSPDVATGTSKANSGILHAGFDAEPGTWKARLNVRGAQLYAELAEGLGISRKATGALVVAKDAAQMETVSDLRKRGIDNGVPGLEIWNRDQLLNHEPNISPEVAGALWAPSGAIVCPFLATVGFAENAIRNGAHIITECAVTGLELASHQIIAVQTTRGRISTRFVVNAAGLHSGDVARLAGDDSFTIKPRRGEYILFDRSVGRLVNTVLFPTPDKVSKGILVSPTVHGNVFIGPDAVDIDDPDDKETTAGGLAGIIAGARRIVPALPLGTAITEFAGLRAAAGKDFVIGPSPVAHGLVHAAGIQSPGLTSAPAIGEVIVDILREVGLKLRNKASFVPVNPAKPNFHELDREAQARLIASDPLFGRVICRCETITEAEIVAAIQSPCGARTVDGVKRRVRAGAGRCQGGFCGPRVTAILARELGIPVTAVRKDSVGSWLFLSRADLEAGRASMREFSYDVVTIGGGPAGMAAAIAAREAGAERVLILERDRELGGILQQCIHNGFGLRRFEEELTGPGYAHRYIDMIKATDIDVWLDTTVLAAEPGGVITSVSPHAGLTVVKAKSVVYAMGCRERTRGAIRTPGSRPAGVFTAGAAQRMVNMEGYLPGKEVVIVGSGDIGLIMARRMTFEGAKVKAVFEIMPYSNGLTRNIVQCLEDFGIPLYLGHSVTAIHGKDRVTGITVSQVNDKLEVMEGTAFDVACDCVLLSVGLIPENELGRAAGIALDPITSGARVDQFRQTSIPGFFAAGNVLHVHDLVDWVSEEAAIAGRSAARHARGELVVSSGERSVKVGEGLRTVVPQRLSDFEPGKMSVRFYFRAAKPMGGALLQFWADGELAFERKLRVVKPSEMIVADIPVRKIGDAATLEFRVVPAPEKVAAEDEIEEEA